MKGHNSIASPTHKSQINEELDQAQTAAADLIELAERLMVMLAPILEDDQQRIVEEAQVSPSLVPLAHSMHHLNEKLARTNRTLQTILRTCQL
jgi:hypothetical protein